ncbi:hypothetical protein EDC56_1237 [Sinobacterium caligoides]|uniref:Uncharacterized protein n=1 Tax=Sinobacterium caligoides TaxID=933926 RepID=A0A3N2E0R3_9GAMM|nr:hypothetical protein [Sinobacterium caligoides]ROS05688.1 hypothetical protein EDC56_1237 [Sinobacterium caligoides]
MEKTYSMKKRNDSFLIKLVSTAARLLLITSSLSIISCGGGGGGGGGGGDGEDANETTGSPMTLATGRVMGGVITGATVTLSVYDTGEKLTQATTEDAEDINNAGYFSLDISDQYQYITSDRLYLLSSEGGKDVNIDTKNSSARDIHATLYLLCTGQELLNGNLIISPLTSAAYTFSSRDDDLSPLSINMYDFIAKSLINKDINGDSVIDGRDINIWDPISHISALNKPAAYAEVKRRIAIEASELPEGWKVFSPLLEYTTLENPNNTNDRYLNITSSADNLYLINDRGELTSYYINYLNNSYAVYNSYKTFLYSLPDETIQLAGNPTSTYYDNDNDELIITFGRDGWSRYGAYNGGNPEFIETVTFDDAIDARSSIGYIVVVDASATDLTIYKRSQESSSDNVTLHANFSFDSLPSTATSPSYHDSLMIRDDLYILYGSGLSRLELDHDGTPKVVDTVVATHSMTSMALSNSTLFVGDGSTLKLYHLSPHNSLSLISTLNVGMKINSLTTINPTQLLVQTDEGSYIVDSTTPSAPLISIKTGLQSEVKPAVIIDTQLAGELERTYVSYAIDNGSIAIDILGSAEGPHNKLTTGFNKPGYVNNISFNNGYLYVDSDIHILSHQPRRPSNKIMAVFREEDDHFEYLYSINLGASYQTYLDNDQLLIFNHYSYDIIDFSEPESPSYHLKDIEYGSPFDEQGPRGSFPTSYDLFRVGNYLLGSDSFARGFAYDISDFSRIFESSYLEGPKHSRETAVWNNVLYSLETHSFMEQDTNNKLRHFRIDENGHYKTEGSLDTTHNLEYMTAGDGFIYAASDDYLLRYDILPSGAPSANYRLYSAYNLFANHNGALTGIDNLNHDGDYLYVANHSYSIVINTQLSIFSNPNDMNSACHIPIEAEHQGLIYTEFAKEVLRLDNTLVVGGALGLEFHKLSDYGCPNTSN